jgi:hypothetical protein
VPARKSSVQDSINCGQSARGDRKRILWIGWRQRCGERPIELSGAEQRFEGGARERSHFAFSSPFLTAL